MKLDNIKSIKTVTGIVVSKKMQKTVVVEVQRVLRHPMYGKVLKLKKKFKVHDENDLAKVGDKVLIVECAPVSKTKHMKLEGVVRH